MKRYQRSIFNLLLGGVVLPVLVCGQGTTLPFDWSTRPKDAGKTVDAPTLQLSSAQQVTIKIVNVNDMFYSYGMGCTSTSKSSGLDELTKLFTVQGEAESECADRLVGDPQRHRGRGRAPSLDIGKEALPLTLVDEDRPATLDGLADRCAR